MRQAGFEPLVLLTDDVTGVRWGPVCAAWVVDTEQASSAVGRCCQWIGRRRATSSDKKIVLPSKEISVQSTNRLNEL